MFGYIVKGICALMATGALIAPSSAAELQSTNKSAYEDALDKVNHIHGAETCESIPPSTYESFLIFNPSNLQTYYFRSYCFQRVAAQMRDLKLCDQVKERKALFLDGSGISLEACQHAVLDKKSKDFEERVMPESIHKIERVDLRSASSGDLEIRVFPAGSLWGTYKFSVALVDGSGKLIGILNELETHLSDRRDPLFVSVPHRRIEELAGSAGLCGKALAVRVGIKLLRDDKGQLQRSALPPADLESTVIQSLQPGYKMPSGCGK
jgi:hypothetical protein